MGKFVNFFDGYQTNSTPITTQTDRLLNYTTDAEFEGNVVNSPEAGNIYFNTTEDRIRYYDGTQWDFVPTGISFTALTALVNSNQTRITTIEDSVGQPNGIASLNASGQVPLSQLPNTLLKYAGTWDASSNTPTLSNGTGEAQNWYRVNVAGTQDLGGGYGPETYNVGDKIVNNGTNWEKWDTTDEVTTVFGRQGDVIAEASDYDANQIDYDNSSSSLVADDVQEAIDEVNTRVDTTQTDLSDHESENAVHGLSSSVVGISDTQIITNKDIDGGTASDNSRITLPKDTKANLDALTRKEGTVVYATDEDIVYYDDGTTLQAVGSGQGFGTGSYNYIENGKAKEDTTGWVLYSNTTPGVRPDDFGGIAAGTQIDRNTTNNLVGDGSFIFSKIDSNNRQGQGVYYQFDNEVGHQGIKLLLSMLVRDNTSTIDAGDIGIYLVSSSDNFTTIDNVISPSNPDLNTDFPQLFKQVQLDSGNKSYRLCIHIQTTATKILGLEFDEVELGPKSIATGAAVTDWQEEAITIGGSTTAPSTGSTSVNRAIWRRVGDSVQIIYSMEQSGSGGSGGSGIYLFPLPSNLSVDLDKVNTSITNPAFSQKVGTCYAKNSSVNGTGIVYVYDNNNLAIGSNNTGNVTVTTIGSAHYSLGFDNDTGYTFNATVPVKGWSSNTRVSEDFGGRDVSIDARGNNGSTVTALTTDINFTYLSGTGQWSGTQFTCDQTGWYIINGSTQFTSNIINSIYSYIDGVQDKRIGFNGNTSISLHPFKDLVYLEKGQTYSIRSSAGATLSNVSTGHYITIKNVGSNQQILETETVAARYTTDSGQSIPNNTDTVIIYEDLDFDTHGAYNTSNGQFTVQNSGIYSINAKFYYNASTLAPGSRALAIIKKNNSSQSFNVNNVVPTTSTIEYFCEISDDLKLEKGDIITIETLHNFGSGRFLTPAATGNTFSIVRIK
jgi:hypothetical protein